MTYASAAILKCTLYCPKRTWELRSCQISESWKKAENCEPDGSFQVQYVPRLLFKVNIVYHFNNMSTLLSWSLICQKLKNVWVIKNNVKKNGKTVNVVCQGMYLFYT